MNESDLGRVVDACEQLTDAVEKHSATISERVSTVSQSILNNLSGDRDVTFYVDVNGSNANSGSSTEPFQTLLHALNIIPAGKSATIKLSRSQKHVVDGNVNCYASKVIIVPDSKNIDQSKSIDIDETTPEIIFLSGSVFFYGNLLLGYFKQSLVINAKFDKYGGISFWGGGAVIIARSKVIVDLESAEQGVFGGDLNYLLPTKIGLREVEFELLNGYLSLNGTSVLANTLWGVNYINELVNEPTVQNTITNIPYAPE
ncbi:hypothetical protein [Pseudoalteromonas sp. SG45-1]|uniref:hypothetical protein n=1 Tax=Pseudoalteromonas sp. SG45-1 TaxID=2760957 RepID=UPI00160168B9|nr:hypothetical protein [Pseudoalteromonas sp. SG45-1]MBB1403143.1 hypothetical protein [Pseudoalteromonas sp. SG45-1]